MSRKPLTRLEHLFFPSLLKMYFPKPLLLHSHLCLQLNRKAESGSVKHLYHTYMRNLQSTTEVLKSGAEQEHSATYVNVHRSCAYDRRMSLATVRGDQQRWVARLFLGTEDYRMVCSFAEKSLTCRRGHTISAPAVFDRRRGDNANCLGTGGH